MNKNPIFDVELLGRKIVLVTSGNVEMDAQSARALAEILSSSARLLDDGQRRADAEEERRKAEAVPVDRSCRVLASGSPVPEDESHREIKSNGQQRDYVVLCDSERSRGFVRPYRDAYKHLKCGKITTMSRAIAETYARDPSFYSGTFCSTCLAHFPVGESGEFIWYEMDGSTGPKVGT